VLPWGATPEAKPAPVDIAPINAKLSALEARVAELGQVLPRVAQLEQRPAPNPADAQRAAQQAGALAALGERLSALEQRITALASAASAQTAADATKGLQAEVQALTQKLDEQSQLIAKQQGQRTSGGDRAAVAVLTLDQLRSVLSAGRPYAAELQAAEALAKDAPDTLAELGKLEGRAQEGVPTVAMLAARLPVLAPSATQASPPAASDESWRARAWAKLKGLVTVRRVGEAPGPSAQSTGDRADAEGALRTGDLAAAVAAVRRAGEPASPDVASWLADAQARLDAEAALSAIDASLVKSLLAEPAASEAKP